MNFSQFPGLQILKYPNVRTSNNSEIAIDATVGSITEGRSLRMKYLLRYSPPRDGEARARVAIGDLRVNQAGRSPGSIASDDAYVPAGGKRGHVPASASPRG